VTLMAFMIDDDNDILCKADEVKSKKLIWTQPMCNQQINKITRFPMPLWLTEDSQDFSREDDDTHHGLLTM
jgi:hypothetical protein